MLFQFIERDSIHGLLASIGRIGQTALRSQARMVGASRKWIPITPAVSQHHTLSKRRCAHRRTLEGVRQTARVLAVRRGLLGGLAGGDPLAGLLSATQGVVSGRSQPIGQDREGLPARPTDSAPHPNAFSPVIMGWTEPSSMANDCDVPANRTSPRQQVQRDHPGSMLSFASGSAIKRITAGVKTRR